MGKKATLQLDMFTAAPAAAVGVELRTTAVPDLLDAVAFIGTPATWADLDMGDAVQLWYDAYEQFVEALNAPIHFCREFLAQPDRPGGVEALHFYQHELTRLTDARGQLNAIITNLYCDNMQHYFDMGTAILKAGGLNEDDVDVSGEFFNRLFQHPDEPDLKKKMPQWAKDVAEEYLRL